MNFDIFGNQRPVYNREVPVLLRSTQVSVRKGSTVRILVSSGPSYM